MLNIRKVRTILLVSLVLGSLPLLAAEPVLTGRWGDTRMPKQLLSPYKSKPTRALVVVALSSVCPLSKRLIPVLNDLQTHFYKQGIQFIGLFPNGMDHIRSMAEFALDTDMNFPIYKDAQTDSWHEVLDLSTTPQVIVLDTQDGYDVTKVVYKGQVNDMWFGGGSAEGKNPYLEKALRSFLDGKKPELTETAASGCHIAKEPLRDLSKFENVTYYKDIVPIMNRTCLRCHRAGESGAELFAELDSYDVVASLHGVILDRVQNRLMPPWHGSMGDEAKQGGFVNDLRLSEEEVNTFVAWKEQGLKAGNASDAPAAPKWPDANDWKISKPDWVFEMAEPYIVPAKRLDEYQYYSIKADFNEDRYIQEIELRPGNKAVVHHMGAIIGPASKEKLTGTEAMLKLYGLTGDKIRKVGDFVPGDQFNSRKYPEGFGLLLPKGYDIIFEMHYTPTGGTEVPDVSRMGIVWAKEKPEHLIETKVFNRKDIRLRPHDMHYKMTNTYAFSTDVIIYALAPHMHFRGKDYRLFKVENPGTPQEKREIILNVPTYDYRWQRTYEYQKPIRLKAGDALYGIVHFDNSHFNPSNPNPEDFIQYGIKSEQEMFNLRVKFERTEFKD